MAIPQNIKDLAAKVRNAVYGTEVRESIAKAIEEAGATADDARVITEQLIDGSFDEGLLNTKIEEKLNDLETQYAPNLTSLESEVEGARGTHTDLPDRLNSVDASLAEAETKLTLQIAETETKLSSQVAETNAVKANKDYVDGLVGGLGANSTFKGKDTNVNILALTGMQVGDEWYDETNLTYLRYNGTSWIDVGGETRIGESAIETDMIQDEAITFNSVDFVRVVGKNILNPYNYTPDKIIDSNLGEVRDSPGYLYTVFIPVLPSTAYYRTISSVVFYDSNKKFISGTTRTIGTFTTPVNAAYMRVVMKIEELVNAQIELGTVGTYYEPFKITVKNLNVSTDELSNNVKKVITDYPSIKETVDSMIVRSKNLFNVNDITDGYTLSGGALLANASYSVSGFISVEENTNYKGNRTLTIAFYDYNKEYIPLSQIGVVGTDYFTSTTGAAYMRIAMPTDSIHTTQVEKGMVTTAYQEYFEPHVPTQAPTILSGKKILFIGDSNTHLNNFPNSIGSRTGAVTYNGGAGGTRLTDFSIVNTTNNYHKFNGCAIADAIATGDWTTLEAATTEIDIAENQDTIPKYRAQLQNIQDACADMNSLSAIVIKYGTNDVNNTGFVLGEPSSEDRANWNGAINYFVKTLSSAYPNVRIYFCSPVFRELMPGSEEATGSPKNSDEWAKSVMLPDMVDAMRDRAKVNHIPFKDLYNESGINKYTAPYFLKDKTHYSLAGDDLVAQKIEGHLLNQ